MRIRKEIGYFDIHEVLGLDIKTEADQKGNHVAWCFISIAVVSAWLLRVVSCSIDTVVDINKLATQALLGVWHSWQ